MNHLGAESIIGEVLDRLHEVCVLNEYRGKQPLGMLIVSH